MLILSIESKEENVFIRLNVIDFRSSSSTRLQQLIPGSIMINDQGEINDLSRKRNTSSSSNALNDFRPSFNRQQTFPQTNDKNIQPWANPYWPQTNSQSRPTDNRYQTATNAPRSTTSNETWKNPYWKDQKPGNSITSPQQQDKPWVNPYWKDSKPQNSTASSQQQNKPWVNPYWKDSKPQTPTTPGQQNKPWVNPYWKDSKAQGSNTSNNQQNKPWVNPYWKDKNTSDQKANESVNNKSSSFEYSALAVPAFYERIYPLHTPSSSPVSTMDLTGSNTIFASALKQSVIDDEEPPFTIDSQGTVHYRAPSSSAANTNKTNIFPPSSTPSQYPVSPPNITEPSSQTSYTASTPKAANNASFLPPNTISSLVTNSANILNYSSVTSSSGNVLTEADLQSIQQALQSLGTNSSTIKVVEAPNDILSFDSSYPKNFSSLSFPHTTGQPSYLHESIPSGSAPHPGNNSSPLAALFSGNPLQQSSQQQTSTAYPQNRSSPLAALFSNNPLQQSNQQPTSTAYPEKHSSPLAGLFSANPLQQSNQQQAPTTHSEKRLSPLSVLFTRQQGNPSTQQHSIPSSNVVYSDDHTSPLSTFFNKTHVDQSNQSPPIIARTSRPYSYDSNAQQLSVYYTPNYRPDPNESSGSRITQKPVVFI